VMSANSMAKTKINSHGPESCRRYLRENYFPEKRYVLWAPISTIANAPSPV
jgi:hypothetical protein